MQRNLLRTYLVAPRRSFTSSSCHRSATLPQTIREIVDAAEATAGSTGSTAEVTVNGWIKSVRRQKKIAFAHLSDGTDGHGLQVVFDDPTLADSLTTGASVSLNGNIVESLGKGQKFELAAKSLRILGSCDPETYPIQKKAHTTEYLRDHANFRPRTDEVARMLRLRHSVRRAFENYYDTHGFVNTHAPLITTNDCEGGGEVFRVLPDQLSEAIASEESLADATSSQKPHDFFGDPAYLTVSSQLHLEVFASTLPRVYTLQPAFRAERSQTSRHLSEFWMLEAEIAFVDHLRYVMDVAEASIKHVLLERAVQENISPESVESLTDVAQKPWIRITYDAAIKSLQSTSQITWGDDISTEQERWIADNVGGGLPVFVTDYPAATKPFYMRQNLASLSSVDRVTVSCFDLLIPRVGELAGGSMREERLDKIEEAITKFGLDPAQYRWYTELRKFGTTPHGGFGLGFERLVSWIGGWENVRECIAAPRWKGRCIL